jgi:hypothetical protein
MHALGTVAGFFGIALILAGTLIALFILAVVAFVVAVNIKDSSDRKKFLAEYKAFLKRISGTRFFFYNSRRSSVTFARESIVPCLEPSIKVVFVDGEDIDIGDDSKFVSHMLYGVKHKKGFPYLIRIDNEEPVDYSVNNLFYNTMNGKKPLEPLLKRISSFYNSSTISE